MLEMIFFYNCIDLIRFWRIKTGGDFGLQLCTDLTDTLLLYVV